jgi:hypothetical protein
VVIVNVGHPRTPTGSSRCSPRPSRRSSNVVRDPIERVNTLLIASEAPGERGAERAAAPTCPRDLRPGRARSCVADRPAACAAAPSTRTIARPWSG